MSSPDIVNAEASGVVPSCMRGTRTLILCVILVSLACTPDPTQSPEYQDLSGRLEATEAAANEARLDADRASQRIEQLEQYLERSIAENERLADQKMQLENQMKANALVGVHRTLVDSEPFVRACGSHVSGVLEDGWRENSVVVGPFAFASLQQLADLRNASEFDRHDGGFPSHKILVVLRPGAVVTVVVPEHERNNLGLLYDPQDWGDNLYEISDGDAATTFVACSSAVDTQFNGGLVAAGPRCVELDLLVGDMTQPERISVSLGSGNCD